jgi:hypothetical protein
MISNILIISDATRQASVSILDAFQMIQKNQPSVKIVFISYLSDLFKKGLGPNTLNHWMQEEKECLEKVKDYFIRMNIPFDDAVIPVPPWMMVFDQIKDGAHDLIVLQGEFLKMWKKEDTHCAICSDSVSKLKCPILVIHSNENTVHY